MKFYDCTPAPSPRRARIFIAEKGIEVETVQVDLGSGEHLGPDFRALNPQCTVPVLELDDGTVITENAGIAAFLEAEYPEPPLLGRTPVEKGLVAMWNARVEFEGLTAVAEALRNSAKGFAGRALAGPENYEQIPELAERGRLRAARFLDMLNERLEGREFVATDAFSMADITAMVVVDFAKWLKLPESERPHLRRWHEAVSARPSATA
ncbi:MAG: glutathione S-transferase family protein [Alphaproteobacteria bacterium]